MAIRLYAFELFILGILAAIFVVSAVEAQGKLSPALRDSLRRGLTREFVWIYLTDKGEHEGHQKRALLMQQAEAALSVDAVARRNRRGTLGGTVTMDDVPVSEQYLAAIQNISHVKVRRKSKWLNAISAEISSKIGLECLTQLPFVKSIEVIAPSLPKAEIIPDVDGSIETRTDSNGSAAEKRKFIKWDSGKMSQVLASLNVIPVHELGYTGAGITVLVLDSGFHTEHEVFANLTIVGEYDFVHEDEIVSDEGEEKDHGSHGTSCLGLILGAKQGTYVGVAPKAKAILAKTEAMTFEERVEEDYFVSGLEWGEGLGADLASSSLGYHNWWTFKDYNGVTSPASLAVDKAVDRGLTVLMAVGNYGTVSMTTPADAAKAIAVGATAALNDQRVASFSSVGPTFDGRIKPEVVAPGQSIPVITYTSYKTNSGTSFSTPIVAGIVALLLEAHPNWSPRHVREALIRTASKATSPSVTYGWGFVDALSALNYEPEVGEESCEGTWDQTNQRCSCEPGYYNPNCDTPVLECSVWCGKQGRCYENMCHCVTQHADTGDNRCIDEAIPGWECPIEDYNDGKICNMKCALEDPDCKGYTLADCGNRKTIPIAQLEEVCTNARRPPPPRKIRVPANPTKKTSKQTTPSSLPPPPPPPLIDTNGDVVLPQQRDSSIKPSALPGLIEAGATELTGPLTGYTSILIFVLFSVIFAALGTWMLFRRRRHTATLV